MPVALLLISLMFGHEEEVAKHNAYMTLHLTYTYGSEVVCSRRSDLFHCSADTEEELVRMRCTGFEIRYCTRPFVLKRNND